MRGSSGDVDEQGAQLRRSSAVSAGWRQTRSRVAHAVETSAFTLRARPEPGDAVLVVSSDPIAARWVADLLTVGSRRRLVAEPLRDHPRLAGDVSARCCYLRPEAHHAGWYDLWREVLTGTGPSTVAPHTHQPWRVPDRYVISEPYACLMAGFVADAFGTPVLWVVSRPDVSADGRDGRRGLQQLLDQPALVADHLEPHRERLAAVEDPVEVRSALWAIENGIARRQLSGRRHCLVHAAELADRPTALVADIEAATGLAPSARALATIARSGPPASRVDDAFLARTEPDPRLSEWAAAFDLADLLG